MRRIPLLALLIALPPLLEGCVTSSPDKLFAATEPTGQAQTTGRYPKIGEVPVGQTTQLTPTEKAITKRELNTAVAQGRAQASQDNQGKYTSEIKQMRKQASESRKKLLEQIETTNRVEQPAE